MDITNEGIGGVRAAVDHVCRRRSLQRFSTRFASACLIWAALYLVLILVSRLTGLIPDIFSPVTVLTVPVLALVTAVLTHRKMTAEDGARLIDEKERAQDLFLTALRLDTHSGEFQPLVARQAGEAAAELRPAGIAPWKWNARFGYALVAIGVLLLIGVITPQLDPFEKRAKVAQANEREKKLEESRQATVMQAQALEQKNAEARSEAVEKELEKLEETFRAARPELKEKTRKELSERQGQLGKLWRQLSDEKLRNTLSKSRAAQRFGAQSPDRKKFREMAEEGKFSDLKKEMEAIKEKLKALAAKPDSAEKRNEMDELREKMQAMADAMAEVLGSESLNDAMSRALEQMDMSNMRDLAQKAMEAMQESMNLTQEELENLAKALQDMENLEQGLSAAQLAKALNEMGELNGKGLDGANGMSDYEKLYREMMEGRGFGQNPGQGEGMKGPGQGEGGNAPENPDAETAFKTEKAKSAMQKGKLLMNIKSKGSAEPGQSADDYRDAIGALREAASEAILQEQVPPGYHDSIRDYFDQMEANPAN